MITRHIHCTVEPEPQPFHDVRTFSVNLGVEAVRSVPPEDGDEANAKDWFEKALRFFGTVSFRLLRWDGTNWTDTGTTLQRISETLDTGAVDTVIDWLADSGASWLSPGSNGDETIEAETAPATYRLRAAQSWSAPVGHRLALTHLVQFTSGPNPNDHVILPAPAVGFDVTTLTTFERLGKDGVKLTYDVDGVGLVTVTTAFFPLGDFDPDSTADLSQDVSAGGYLKVDKDAEIVWRMVDWLETRSGSAFAVSTALLDLARDRSNEEAGPAPKRMHFDAIVAATYSDSADKAAAKTALVWFCVTHLCAALDSLILGLTAPSMPSDDPAPAVLIAPFVDRLAELAKDDSDLLLDPGSIIASFQAVAKSRTLLQGKAQLPPDLFIALRQAYQTESRSFRLHSMLGVALDPEKAFDAAFSGVPYDMLAEAIRQDLNEIEQLLQDEGGAEATLSRLLGPNVPTSLVDWHCLINNLDNAARDRVRGHVEVAWSHYASLINGSFNAAEAARNAASREIARVVLDAARNLAPPPDNTPERLRQVLIDGQFFRERVQETPTGCFADVAKALPRLPLPVGNSLVDAFLADLDDAWSEPIEQLVQLVASYDSLDAFSPDLAPVPLPIQIAASISAEDALTFTENFNGIAVAIRRIDNFADDASNLWAHANLARLNWKSKHDQTGDVTETAVPHAIHTSYPAVSDGSGPMFLNYEGRPFVMPATMTRKDGARPFYTSDLPEELGSFAPIPELAYGRSFQTFAFVTTNAGTLPKALQDSADRPWMPKAFIVPPDEAFIDRTDCQRRTAIGRTEIIEIVEPGKAKRLGARIAGVHPLAQDYPDPAPPGGPREPDAALLLLAPEGDVWRKDAQNAVSFRLSAPRVNFRDFERWIANPDLFTAAFASDRKGGEELLDALRLIHEIRDLDSRIGPMIDRMPDPAVHSLHINLRATDGLTDSLPMGGLREWELAKSLVDFAKLPDVKEAITALTAMIKAPDLNLKTVVEIILTRLLLPLDRHFCADLTVKVGVFGILPETATKQVSFTIRVPAGLVARLTVDAKVSAGLFKDADGHPAAIHAGLKRFCRPDAGAGFLYFPSAAMRIETMFDGFVGLPPDLHPEKLASKMIAIRPVAGARSYLVETRDRMADLGNMERTERGMRLWRLIGEIDVATQRWRPTGRPLYHHIDPTGHISADHDLSTKAGDGAAVALPISLTSADVGAFETDAFLDRSDADFLPSLPQKVAPLGSGTVLLEQPWTDFSATYFRHRFVLRSRYFGAMKSSSIREVGAWTNDQEGKRPRHEAWTHRVAMRAELSRLELTRPQLRALIPLTTGPSATDAVPPVMAVLQERPYDRGGLADLVLSELKTGFGYGFPDKTQPLSLVDSRKEIGPDPRLTYRPLNDMQATGLVLSAEGTVGLTFDPANAPAPAFPNAVMLLSPVSLQDAPSDLTEHHLALQLWRTFRPGWVFPSETIKSAVRMSPADSWWIEVNGDRDRAILEMVKPQDAAAAGTSNRTILAIGPFDGHRGLWVNPQIVDPRGATTEEPIPIASWDTSHLHGLLVILHRPSSPGRCLTSILGTLSSPGQGNPATSSPVVLASFEWPVPAGAELLVPDDAFRLARKTSASGATSLAWTRTSADADKVRILKRPSDIGLPPDIETVSVDDLAAVLSEASLSFRRTGEPKTESLIVPSLLTSKVPLNVQRHVAVILTSQLEGPGRPIEEFRRAALMFKATTDLGEVASAERLRNPLARIVEIETPAVILCDKEASAVPSTYREAYLDLLSHRPERTGADWHARFLLRFNTSQKLATVGHELTLQSGAFSLTFAPSPDGAAVGVLAVEITIGVTDATATQTMRFLHTNETVSEPILEAKFDSSPLWAEGLKTKMTVSGAKETAWGDLSALWSWRNQASRSFDFDWLFGPPRDPSLAPEGEVGPAALAEMREAQARIISMSPPIPVHHSRK